MQNMLAGRVTQAVREKFAQQLARELYDNGVDGTVSRSSQILVNPGTATVPSVLAALKKMGWKLDGIGKNTYNDKCWNVSKSDGTWPMYVYVSRRKELVVHPPVYSVSPEKVMGEIVKKVRVVFPGSVARKTSEGFHLKMSGTGFESVKDVLAELKKVDPSLRLTEKVSKNSYGIYEGRVDFPEYGWSALIFWPGGTFKSFEGKLENELRFYLMEYKLD